MKRIDRVLLTLQHKCSEANHSAPTLHINRLGFSAQAIADLLQLERSNVSRDLNALYKLGKIKKTTGKPALFYYDTVNTDQAPPPPCPTPQRSAGKASAVPAVINKNPHKANIAANSEFANLIGTAGSLSAQIKQAQAAVLYPPHGLHTLLLGETGVGKSMFAEIMYHFARDNGRLTAESPFAAFNCADYASNPQLLLGQLFGVTKGAYTGADKDRPGLIEKADGGILFLDEIHRLPPEGQEMLFHLIDHGRFRRLGETDRLRQARVLIIAATTENPASVLLNTFCRRIPMVIHIPPLRERPFTERLELIRLFFHSESLRVGTSIRIKTDALRAFSSYECTGNIGQLRSDIQLSCAGAFLEAIKQQHNELKVTLNTIPEHVKKGLLKAKRTSNEMQYFLERGERDMVVPCDMADTYYDKNELPDNFYELTQDRYHHLRQEGLSEQEIYKVIKMDTELHFRRHLGKFNDSVEFRHKQLAKVVNKELLVAVEEALSLAESKLSRIFPADIFYGLVTHVEVLIDRLAQGKEVRNPHVYQIREEYPAEFDVAGEMARLLGARLKITVPFNEIGFISLFLTSLAGNETRTPRVGILVVAHGSSTASAMAELANTLFGVDHAHALNVSLDQSPEDILLQVENLVKQIDQGVGVLLLVDMGFLLVFEDIIAGRTGIKITTVEMVSTPMVLEAVRRSFFSGNSLSEIAAAVMELRPYSNITNFGKITSSRVILTTCLTGAGSALRLQGILEDWLPELGEKAIEISPVSLAAGKFAPEELAAAIQNREVIAVVGTLNPELKDVPFFSTESILTGNGLSKLRLLIHGIRVNLAEPATENGNREVLMEKIKETFIKNMRFLNPYHCVEKIGELIKSLEAHFGLMDDGLVAGFTMHLGSALERMIKGTFIVPDFPLKSEFQTRYCEEIAVIQASCQSLSDYYEVHFSNDELCYLLQLILQSEVAQYTATTPQEV